MFERECLPPAQFSGMVENQMTRKYFTDISSGG